jgi:hypothetical protein
MGEDDTAAAGRLVAYRFERALCRSRWSAPARWRRSGIIGLKPAPVPGRLIVIGGGHLVPVEPVNEPKRLFDDVSRHILARQE